MIPKAPCLNCPDRAPACHSSCEKYISFRKEKDRINDIRLEERLIDRATKDLFRKRRITK